MISVKLTQLNLPAGSMDHWKLSSTRVISIPEYLKEVTLLDRAPRNRLIEAVDDDFPFLTSDRVRKLMRSGLLPLYFSKTQGLSIPDTDFTEENLGVLPGLDLLVFRSLNMSRCESEISNCYKPFLKLFKALVGKYAGHDAISQLPKALDLHLKYLELAIVKDYRVIYDPALFPKVLISVMYCEVHRLLREQCPARGKGIEANAIMEKIEMRFSDFMDFCRKNALLISYSGAHGERLSRQHIVGSEDGGDETRTSEVNDDVSLKVRTLLGNKDLSVEGKRTIAGGGVVIVPGDELTGTLMDSANSIQRPTAGYDHIRSAKKKVMSHVKQMRVSQIRLLKLLQEKGMHKDLEIDLEGPKNASVKLKARQASAIVDTHRHGMAHAVQPDNVHLVERLPEVNQEGLSKEPYDVNDVIDLFQYKCSDYLSVAADEFDEMELWDLLDLPTRFPIPDIYNL
jgi:hypothetical protein